MNPGDFVAVRPPFSETYPGTHTVASTSIADDGQPIVYLESIEPAFAPEHLEPTA